jgi:NADPH:quinone reductase
MQALKFNKTGSLEELKVVSVDDPVPQSGEVIVRVLAAAINPSDVKSVLGKLAETRTPRIPGRDFAGIVISDSKWKGKSVFGSGGRLGLSKDGTHAEFVAVPESGLVELPKNISFSAATAMGLSYLTAWQSVVVAGQLKSQETVLITGAAGAVGSAAIRIAKYLGANVIGTISSHPLAPDLSGTIQSISLKKEKLDDALKKLTYGRGADLIVDVVGGLLFEPCIECLSQHGRQIAISCAGDPRVSFNLVDFYHKQAHLIGVDTLKLSIEECASILESLVPGMERGLFIPGEIDEIPLTDAPRAYEEIQSGKAKNKKVFVFPMNLNQKVSQ